MALLVSALALGMATASASTPDEDNLAAQIFRAINQKRVQNGRATIATDGGLSNDAQGAAEYNRASCSPACHTPNGPAHFEIVYWGDGPVTAERAVKQWMESDAHRTNILSNGATAGGVGVAVNPSIERTWAVVWFNGGDTAPVTTPTIEAPKPTTTRATSTATTQGASASTEITVPATTTTSSTIDTSTTSTTNEPKASSTQSLRLTKQDGGSSALPGVIAGAAAFGAALITGVVVRRRRTNE